MSPSREAYETTLAEGGFQAMAMSVLASGALSADKAIEYVSGLPNMQSIVFGASSRGNILATKAIIDKYMP
jgi:hypothetical protein